MTSKDRLMLMGLGAVAAFSSAAIVHVFSEASIGHHAAVPPAAARPSLPTASIAKSPDAQRLASTLEKTERLAYVPGERYLLRDSYPPLPAAGENPDAWEPQTEMSPDSAWSTQTAAGTDWQTDVEARPTAKAVQSLAPAPTLALPRLTEPETQAAPSSSGPSLPPASLKERLAQISPSAMARIKDKFASASAAWPPTEITLIGLKDKRVLELYARTKGGAWQHVHRYAVLAASGQSGPKLRQGDKQVPEGIYSVSFLNPNSRYHVSMRLNYPNDFDRQMAAKDGRKQLGGDIMIHGKAVSIGCLAVGDEAAEELFVLAAETGLPNLRVIIAPADFRKDAIPERQPGQPDWLPKLYTQVASALSEFPKPPSTGLLSFFEN